MRLTWLTLSICPFDMRIAYATRSSLRTSPNFAPADSRAFRPEEKGSAMGCADAAKGGRG